jgi:hypothetical protein
LFFDFTSAASIKPAATPANSRPNPFMQIIPRNLRNDLHACDRARDLDPPGEEPTDSERVERSKGSPADGFENRPRMRFCPAE